VSETAGKSIYKEYSLFLPRVIARSEATKQSSSAALSGLLRRFARNDGPLPASGEGKNREEPHTISRSSSRAERRRPDPGRPSSRMLGARLRHAAIVARRSIW